MPRQTRDAQRLTGFDLKSLSGGTSRAHTLGTIQKNVFVGAFRPLAVVVLRAGEEADVREVQTPDNRMLCIGGEGLGRQHDHALAINRLFKKPKVVHEYKIAISYNIVHLIPKYCALDTHS